MSERQSPSSQEKGEAVGDQKIGVLGAGSWGTTLANLLAHKGFSVNLWVYEEDLCQKLKETRENTFFLPGIKLHPRIVFSNSLMEVCREKDLILTVVPSQFVRKVMAEAAVYIRPEAAIVNASKGIESESLLTVTGVLQDVLPPIMHANLAVLSGPSFAREVALGQPTVVAIASHNYKLARNLQRVFYTPKFRIYTNNDVIGVEIGGSLKNVIAIASGACEGMGLGKNSQAALLTRGLAEITRLGLKMGANPMTFSGLTGLGDLILTCTSPQSRNYTVGVRLGRGETPVDILKDMKMVAEGVKTAHSAYHLARKCQVEMPIITLIYQALYEGKPARQAVAALMTRTLKGELDGLSF